MSTSTTGAGGRVGGAFKRGSTGERFADVRCCHRRTAAGSTAAAQSVGGPEYSLQLPGGAMETRKLRVGQPITPEQFEALTDEQLARLVPRAYREFFPGKDFCADGCFYLHDGTAWSFFKAGFLDD